MKKTLILSTRFQFITTGILLLFLGAFGIVTPASAAETPAVEESSITLSPVNNKFTIDAGNTLSDTVKVLNTGSSTLDFILYARPYEVKNDAYEPSYNGTASNSDAYKWVRFEKTKYSLEAGKSIDIPYTVDVPQGAAPGGHYGVIFIETKAPEGNGQAVVRNKRLGMILLATVNGQYRTGGSYEGTKSSFFQFRSPLTTTTRVKNSGNADFPATLTFRVSDMFNQTKFEEKKEYNVLPETTRAIPMNWQDSPWFGLYRVNVQAQLLDQNHASQHYVLIMPRWMIAVLVVLLLAGGVYVLRRRN